MNKKSFESLSKDLGFTKIGNDLRYQGQINEYPVEFTNYLPNNTNVLLPTINFSFNEQINKQIIKDLNRHLKKLARVYLNGANSLFVTIQVTKNKYDIDHIRGIISTVLQGFQFCQLTAPTTCPNCKQDNCDTMIKIDGRMQAAHHYCLRSIVESKGAEAHEKERNANNLLGTVGGLLGGVLASILTILTIHFLNLQVAYLYIVIPLAIFWGFKLFRGKPGVYALILTVIWSLAQIFVIQGATYHLYLISQGYPTTLLDSFRDIFNLEYFSIMFEDVGFGFLFIIFGIFICLGDATKNAKKQVKEVQSSVDESIPYNSNQFQ